MRFRAAEVARATGGGIAGPDVELVGASYDSRTIRPGELFVPIVAERDGHDFVGAAGSAGAAAYLTSRGPLDGDAGMTAIEVADTRAALNELAAWAVRRLGLPIVAITGSVGKTTTKDLAAAALGAQRRVAANVRSFNNDLGLPVTVLGTPDGDDGAELLILEMGMNAAGEIARLCQTAPPRIGVVTRVAAAHSGPLGGIDGVAAAKAELIDALPADGVAILNADDRRVAAMARRSAAPVLTFGEQPGADVRIAAVELDDLARPRIELATPWGECAMQLSLSGRHMAINAAAAIATAGAVGVDLAAAAAALETAELSASRMSLHRTPAGGVLIDDAYNANPESMRAALDALAAIPARRRIAVLGVMAELDDPVAEHRRIADYAAGLGIELVAAGTELYGPVPADDPIAAVGEITDGVAVVVKGSLVAALQSVAAALRASGQDPAARRTDRSGGYRHRGD